MTSDYHSMTGTGESMRIIKREQPARGTCRAGLVLTVTGIRDLASDVHPLRPEAPLCNLV